RYLHFNLKDEQQVNGQENAHHTIYNGFWAPTGKPNTYNIYLYAKDGATVSGADLRALRKEVDRINGEGYVESEYNANSWRFFEEALAEAEEALEENQEVLPPTEQTRIDNLRSALIEAENGLNKKAVYVEPEVPYAYILYTEDDSEIQVGDIFAIYSNNGTARNNNRVLHSKGNAKTDKVQATLQQGGKELPLEANSTYDITVDQLLWEVVSMEGGKKALQNLYPTGNRYLDLSQASTDNIHLSSTPKAITFETVDAEAGTFKIMSDEENGYALNYASTSFKTAAKTEAGVLRLFKKTKPELEIASSTHEKGTVSGQPMAAGTGGSDNFRIPSLITLSDGTIIGAADARWNHEMDFSAIDIMMVKSKDDGQTWEYSFPIYFNDSTDSRHNRATTFIDPLMVRDKNDKIYLMSDVFPGSTANGYAPYPPERASGYVDIKGAKRMVLYTSPYPEHQNSENFAYYVGEHSTDELKLAPIYEVFGENDYAETPSFYMDKKFNLYDVNKQPMYCNQLNSSKVVQQNVFYWNSILHVRVAMYLYLITSEDGGSTWSDPMILNPQIRKEDGNDSFYGVGPGAGLWLDNGTEHGMVILPTYSATDFNSQRAQFIYSVDGGATWKRSENVTKNFWSGENCVVQIDDTTLRHFYISGTARLQYTDHVWEDGTWKAGDPVTMNDIIRTSNNQISAINYSKTIKGEKVIIYSTAKHNGGNRVNGTIYVFTVDKDTKALKLQAEYDITPIVQPEGGEAVAEDSFQYSSIAELKDGSIGMLHEYDGAKIIYKKFTMSDIAPNVVFDGDENTDEPTESDYENIWVTGVTDKVYDGSKQTQNIKVYDGNKLLRENVDYTISYKNNVNANTYTEDELKAFEEEYSKNSSVKSVGNFIAAKEAQVVLKMKGDYSGTRSIFFRIEQQDIKNEERFIVDNISAQATKKSQKPVPTVTWLMEDGTVKTLKYKKDFIIPEYEGSSSFIGASENEEGYQLTVQGIGNFMGDRPISYKITKGEEVSLSKVTIKAAKSVAYTGQELKPEITVKYKNEPLVLDKDYEVIYTNNKAAGTGTALIRGLEGVHGGTSFIGTKRITFKITGTAMSGAKVTGFDSSYPYSGEVVTPVDGEKVKVSIKDKTLILGEDYEVSYEKNINKGTATVIIKGNPEAGFTGTKKVTFKIGTAALSTAEDSDFTFTFKNAKDVNTYAYTKGGVKPSIELSFKDTVLREGVDYTLSYKNNKALGEATVSIKGKGNFAGTVNESFNIVKKDVTEFTDSVYLEVKDIVEGKSIKQSFKVMDEDGKALSNNKDYNSKAVVYTLVSLPEGTTAELTPGSPITDLNTKLPKGSVVSITVPLAGDFYAGEVTETYRIIEKTYDISKAKIVLLPQEFTGEEITITKDSMFKTRKMSDGTVLTLEGDNANIEVVRYQNNIKKGTAKVTFKGKEGTNFGGYKTVTFKINARTVHNAWEGVVENLKNLFSF
ncbi:MAG: exo-alpha-sialidase, partial [Lachnospiraceae bacterium]|nr:exo-alpha-sialidase [Lachnospiraceae bacterium]